jgi:signal transduction histidine kinase/ActR/RegA family two-component response regulator
VREGHRNGAADAAAPSDHERCAEAWTRSVREGVEYEIEVRHRRHDGAYRWFVTRAVPWKDEQGRVISWFGITTDIHEQKELQERLREADRRKDEFLATLAHELRNPLAPIRNSLEVMRRAGEQREAVDTARAIMERQLIHMVRLVDDLLDLSRITRGRIELRRERIRLAAALEDALETCRPQFEERGQELTLEAPESSLLVDGDRTRLAQVFTNLLSNASKYSPRGSPVVIRAQDAGEWVSVSVRDQGIGIAPEALPRIFDIFSQAVRSNELTDGGLGIGLSLVRSLVDQHGGRVEALSEGLGRGSEFIVHLPVAREAPPAGAHEADSGDGRMAPRRRVLIADDNRDSADSLAIMLSLMGHETQATYDGSSAIEKAGTFRPEVILLDLGMPVIDGYEAARRIREQAWSNGVVLVALTGWGQEEDRARARDAGFNFHLTKPANPQALRDLLGGTAARQDP